MKQEEIRLIDPIELERRKQLVRNSFFEAGADYVIDNLSEIGDLIDKINEELAS